MGKCSKWITPFVKQCFVTLGVCLNMGGHSLTMGYSAILLEQLKQKDSIIPVTDSSASWIASVHGFTLVAGNFIVPSIMANYGRKTANLIAVLPMLVGWFCVVSATNVATLLVARLLQGLSMGMNASLGPILIGEYTSPNNRGAFLTSISLTLATGVLIVHTLGSCFSWQTTALTCAFIAFVDLIIIIYSPESPSWLAEHGKYDDCKRVFRWLRGDGEEEELQRMIESSIVLKEAKVDANVKDTFGKKIQDGFTYFNRTVKKREFYKPIFIMMHIYTLGQWAGANVLVSYINLIFDHVTGPNLNIPLMIMILDTQRIIANAGAVYVMRIIKRRTMLLVTVSINLFAFVATAAYTYFKSQNMLPFDHPAIGVILMHIHMFSIATGTVPLPFIIAGELFPLEFRSLSGGISVLFLSLNLFITVKTAPSLLNTIGLHGAYLIYAGIVAYCLVVALIFLPETKNRTLQDIEDEFRGKLATEDPKSMVPLNTEKPKYHADRRVSSPFL